MKIVHCSASKNSEHFDSKWKIIHGLDQYGQSVGRCGKCPQILQFLFGLCKRVESENILDSEILKIVIVIFSFVAVPLEFDVFVLLFTRSRCVCRSRNAVDALAPS